MFKKIEIWILYLVLLLGIPVTISFGLLVRQELKGNIKLGSVSKTALFLAEIPVNIKKILIANQSSDLKVEDRFPLLRSFKGTPNSQESYLLFSRYDGDLREGIVELVDLTNFKVLHTWNPDIDEFNRSVKKKDEFKFLKRDHNNSRMLLRHPILLNDGGLVVQDQTPLIKIDNCSNLIFQNTHDYFHHSIETDIEGNIWVPSHMYPQSLPIQKVGRNLLEEAGYIDDGIVKLSPDGKILFEKSVSQIFIDNGLEYLLFSRGFIIDPIHLNDIQPVDFDGEYWKKGDVFLSPRYLSAIIHFRPSNNKVINYIKGPFAQQHDIDIISNKEISIFNNNNFITDNEYSEILIYNFETNKFRKLFNNQLKNNNFETQSNGLSEILDDGSLMVEETIHGRIILFDQEGKKEWEFVNKDDNGDIGRLGWSRIIEDVSLIEKFKKLVKNNKC